MSITGFSSILSFYGEKNYPPPSSLKKNSYIDKNLTFQLFSMTFWLMVKMSQIIWFDSNEWVIPLQVNNYSFSLFVEKVYVTRLIAIWGWKRLSGRGDLDILQKTPKLLLLKLILHFCLYISDLLLYIFLTSQCNLPTKYLSLWSFFIEHDQNNMKHVQMAFKRANEITKFYFVKI